MSNKPVVFISATSDLRSARDLVGKVLYAMGYEPVWQDVAATEGGELLDVLRRRIAPCAMMVQLVGNRYGAEPPQPTAEFGRVSYTQFEALYAERLGRQVIYQLVGPDFPCDPAPPEAEEPARLQEQYKEKLVATNRLRQTIATASELELSIWKIKNELQEFRTKAERRAKRTFWLIGAALGGVAVVAGLVLAVLSRQAGTETRVQRQSAELKDELAAMRSELLAAVAAKPLAQRQTRPDPLPPEMIEKAKALLQRGNAEDQALAKMALGRHAEADRIIQELKSQPGNPLDEAFRLLTLEGDNWYRAGEPDKAIAPYEKALALRPEDVRARNNVTIAHSSARLGSIRDHQQRAIEVAEGTLKFARRGSTAWAETEYELGVARVSMPAGDKQENIRKAIDCYRQALTVYTKTATPIDWAETEYELGVAWVSMPADDKRENVRKAIDCYRRALSVYTRAATPADWAMIEYELGIAWASLPAADRKENFRKAIDCFQQALTVYTKAATPVDWAMTRHELGLAWANMPTGDKAENLRRAIACFKAALLVYSPEAFADEHDQEMAVLRTVRRQYEALPAAKINAFDDIRPAE